MYRIARLPTPGEMGLHFLPSFYETYIMVNYLHSSFPTLSVFPQFLSPTEHQQWKLDQLEEGVQRIIICQFNSHQSIS